MCRHAPSGTRPNWIVDERRPLELAASLLGDYGAQYEEALSDENTTTISVIVAPGVKLAVACEAGRFNSNVLMIPGEGE